MIDTPCQWYHANECPGATAACKSPGPSAIYRRHLYAGSNRNRVVVRSGNANQLERYRRSTTGGTASRLPWYRCGFLRFSKYSRILGPSRSMRRVPVAILLRMESAISSPSIPRRHSLGSYWEATCGRVPFPGLHDLEEVHGAPRRDRSGREVIRYEQLRRFVQVHTLAVAAIAGETAPVQVAHHVGQPGVARDEQPAARSVPEHPPKEALAAPHLRDHDDRRSRPRPFRRACRPSLEW